MEAFHQLSKEEKMKLAPKHYMPKNKNIYQGFFPLEQNDDAHKEFFQLGRSLDEISEWEREGCQLYEPVPWFENEKRPDMKWVIEVF